MSESNKRTLLAYENHIIDYIDGTPQEVTGDVKAWIDESLKDLPNTARILEVGSALGRDADYIEAQGYEVDRSDATVGFVEYLKQQGHDVKVLNIIEGEIDEQYDLIIANAVLLHFTREETATVIKKICESLNSGGIFSFSIKHGEGEEWSEAKLSAPRYFCYWDKDLIGEVLKHAGFGEISYVSGSADQSNAKWIHIIAKK